MTQQELFEQIRQLPLIQKIEILETVFHDLGEELRANGENSSSVTQPAATREEKLAAMQRLQGLLKIEVTTAESDIEDQEPEGRRLSQRLYGILKFEGEPPTDAEIKDARADYLMEKYS